MFDSSIYKYFAPAWFMIKMHFSVGVCVLVLGDTSEESIKSYGYSLASSGLTAFSGNNLNGTHFS
jgi:hypothetical protein